MAKTERRYNRIMLKLSGQALAGEIGFGIDHATADYVASQVVLAVEMGTEVGVVIGGGNIWRGEPASARGIDRATADYMGMLATVINGLALQSNIEKRGVPTRVQTAITMVEVAEPYIRRRAVRHLEKERVVIFAAGTGNPYFSTDTAAALRAMEIGAEVLLMAKNRVDGVYNADPATSPGARKYDRLDYMQFIELGLEVMDKTAVTMCMENKLPIIVFGLYPSDNLRRIIEGEHIGTLIH